MESSNATIRLIIFAIIIVIPIALYPFRDLLTMDNFRIVYEALNLPKVIEYTDNKLKGIFAYEKVEYKSNYHDVKYELAVATSTFGYTKAQLNINDVATTTEKKYNYIKIINSCDANYVGDCVNVRTAPETSAPSIYRLRNGVVLKVAKKVTINGTEWYRIAFDEWLRYPERLNSAAYVSAKHAVMFEDVGIVMKPKNSNKVATTTLAIYNSSNTEEIIPTFKILDKAYAETGNTDTISVPKNKVNVIDITDIKYNIRRIEVDISEQKLYAYEGDKLYLETPVSTGVRNTPTPIGIYTIYRKTPTRYMQGPIPGESDHYYDLPGVPWDMYFTSDGAAIHGAYWHNDFGNVHSNGCVNVPLDIAEKLYRWADVGTKVYITK